jgi:predicted dehydrogenase/threonine dehydrogenase-like Zn-dependent dehydrogenase
MVLIQTSRSLISAGTERMLVEFSQGNLLKKARSQPEKVRQVLDKVRTDGLMPTLDAVRSKLDQPLPLGYCNAGVVVEVSQGVSGFAIGDRVASNGPHAELVCVPKNLCALIPDKVGDEGAAFTVLAAVGLQGIRLAQPSLGESVVVIGLGLIGLLTVQMLLANGCRVLGLDFDGPKLELARGFGAQTVPINTNDPVEAALAFSEARGVDVVLITASTKSSEPVRQAALMCRKRGRIVLVGVTGLELSRADFYEKELSFQVSCSYGPGRYDPSYEEAGQDYPLGFVRWTEQRNFEAVLELLASGRLDVMPLISHRIPLAQVEDAYRLITDDKSTLGVILNYPASDSDLSRTILVAEKNSVADLTRNPNPVPPVVGVIGAGNFTTGVLLPALSKTAARLKNIASAGGVSAAIAARKFKFELATTDTRSLLNDPEINTVFITTRHNTHAQLVVEALEAGKHVFVEKPLALNREALARVAQAIETNTNIHLMVGFNRRFSPLVTQMKQLLAQRSQPLSLIYTVNAGAIPPSHWTQDANVGGGRIIGEACHFVDLLRHLVGQSIAGVEACMMGMAPGLEIREDKMTILLEFADGSIGTVHYLANGSKRYPKERVEVFSSGRVLVLDNFKSLKGYAWKGFKSKRLWRQDKGHGAEVQAFIKSIAEGGPPLIPWPELAEVTLATFAAVERAAEPPRPIGPD